MAGRIIWAVLVLHVLVLPSASLAQKQLSDAEKAASKAGWDDAWSWGNALAVKTYFEQLYYPHAKALIEAEARYGLRPSGEFAATLADLKSLPGVKGAVLSLNHPQPPERISIYVSDVVVQLDTLSTYVLPERNVGRSPMMKRTVGGKVGFCRAQTGKGPADLLVIQGSQGDPEPNADWAVSLILDPQWLIAQIPSAMDSLYRENVQLLFAAASPQNKIWEQSLGIIAGKDTLWWVGRKDVKIANEQVLWPFENIKVASYVHTLEKQ